MLVAVPPIAEITPILRRDATCRTCRPVTGHTAVCGVTPRHRTRLCRVYPRVVVFSITDGGHASSVLPICAAISFFWRVLPGVPPLSAMWRGTCGGAGPGVTATREKAHTQIRFSSAALKCKKRSTLIPLACTLLRYCFYCFASAFWTEKTHGRHGVTCVLASTGRGTTLRATHVARKHAAGVTCEAAGEAAIGARVDQSLCMNVHSTIHKKRLVFRHQKRCSFGGVHSARRGVHSVFRQCTPTRHRLWGPHGAPCAMGAVGAPWGPHGAPWGVVKRSIARVNESSE